MFIDWNETLRSYFDRNATEDGQTSVPVDYLGDGWEICTGPHGLVLLSPGTSVEELSCDSDEGGLTFGDLVPHSIQQEVTFRNDDCDN